MFLIIGLSIALIICAIIAIFLWFRLRETDQWVEQRQDLLRTNKEQMVEFSSFPKFGQQSQMLSSPLFLVVASCIEDGLVVVNNERKVCFLNNQAKSLLGIDSQDVQLHGIITILRDYQADAMIGEVIRDGEMRDLSVQSLSKQQTLHLRCAALTSHHKIEGAVLLIRDVTQINMLERSRRDLVANVSHELRTPLSSLKLLVETLQSNPPPEVMQRMLGQMDQEIEVVTQLVDELHELSQIELGRVALTLVPGDIATVITCAINRIHPQADRKHIHLESLISEHRFPVLMDEQRIGQVLLNLLHNAVKFTQDHGKIIIRSSEIWVSEQQAYGYDVHHTEQNASNTQETKKPITQQTCPEETAGIALPPAHPQGLWMLLSIADTGIGIPTQEIPRIFERFYKVDRSRARSSGTGLGLAIAKHLIEGHGGRLWVESEEGRGSTFYFTIPMA